MDASRFDALARSLIEIRTRRGAVRGLLLGAGGLLSLTAAEDAAAKNCRKIKNKKRRKKCLARAETCATPCGSGCCSADTCFAESVDDQNGEPLGFACCPAQQLCRSTTTFPDQCCYPDETCRPSLAEEFPLEAQTICCRPCAGGVDGCCLNVSDECVDGVCTPSNTARLARTRRPG